ncbi:RNA polymerase sigma factor [Anaerovorax odorimutans]|uniref:RNA polymerase sigma factor n=1 Tax=Anaerovorax odorimutans TaxID=109327 RepID=UPI00041A62A5|nr:sigma-70 family RNA polymerase sigma factor [Anaerovorax odorimutans]
MEIEDLSHLIKNHGKEIYGFCYKLTKDKHHADDLYQDTFLKATELCRRIDTTQNPKSFLIAISIRIWKNQRRKYGWRNKIAKIETFQDGIVNNTEMADVSTPEYVVLNNECNKMVEMACEKLNDKLKIPLYLYYNVCMPVEDISEVLKIPKGTVKSRLHKGRKTVKEFLEVNGYEGF